MDEEDIAEALMDNEDLTPETKDTTKPEPAQWGQMVLTDIPLSEEHVFASAWAETFDRQSQQLRIDELIGTTLVTPKLFEIPTVTNGYPLAIQTDCWPQQCKRDKSKTRKVGREGSAQRSLEFDLLLTSIVTTRSFATA